MNKTMVLVTGADETSVLTCLTKLNENGFYAADSAVGMELAISKFQQGSYQAVVFAGKDPDENKILEKIFSFQQPELVFVDDDVDINEKIAAGLARRIVVLDNALEFIDRA